MRVQFKMSGYRGIRTSPGVAARVKAIADGIADDCNASADVDGGYKAEGSSGRNRARAAVITTNAAAMKDNARNNTIIRAAGRAR